MVKTTFTPVHVEYTLSDAQKRYVQRTVGGGVALAMVAIGSTLQAAATILRMVGEPVQHTAMLAINITLLVLNLAFIGGAVMLRGGARWRIPRLRGRKSTSCSYPSAA